MKLIFYTKDETQANLKLSKLQSEGKRGIIKYNTDTCGYYNVYQTNKIEHDDKMLPQWAQKQLSDLRATVQELESYRKLHAVLSDKDRDWFTLPDPFNGCTEDELNLWILTKNHPFSICALYKGDLLFIGRATKERYGHRLVEPEKTNPMEAKFEKQFGDAFNVGAIIDKET